PGRAEPDADAPHGGSSRSSDPHGPGHGVLPRAPRARRPGGCGALPARGSRRPHDARDLRCGDPHGRVVRAVHAAGFAGRYPGHMTTRDELERLPTKELHDRAIERAKHHLDIGFLWELVKALPVAEEVVGEDDRSKIDI